MNLKPQTPDQMYGFIQAMHFLDSKFDEDKDVALVVTESELSFNVTFSFVYAEVGNEVKRKDANNSFTWLKSESLDVLNKYIQDCFDEIYYTNIDIINNLNN